MNTFAIEKYGTTLLYAFSDSLDSLWLPLYYGTYVETTDYNSFSNKLYHYLTHTDLQPNLSSLRDAITYAFKNNIR